MLGVVTNRLLCKDNFLDRIEQIAKAKPDYIFLREKDLNEKEYELLALQCKKICEKNGVTFVINSFFKTAEKLKNPFVHLSVPLFYESKEKLNTFQSVSVSVHSLEEAKEVEKGGVSFLIAGHIFPTDCKKEAAPRGVEFLKIICENVHVPVLGIGGIGKKNIKSVMEAGASGVCIMSQFMICENPYDEVMQYKLLSCCNS